VPYVLAAQCPPIGEAAQLKHAALMKSGLMSPQTASVVPGAHVPALQQPPWQSCVALHADVQRLVALSHA
jgi:hypothetical protein